MRIIDSNKDYYDYLQNVWRDETITFDRRDSYNLSKSEFADAFRDDSWRLSAYAKKLHGDRDKHKFVLLQVCNKFWLFDLLITKSNDYGRCQDYELHLNCSWQDYTCPAALIRLSAIHPDYINHFYKHIETIKRGEYEELRVFNKFTILKSKGNLDDKDVRHIPILKNIGIAAEVPPEEIFLALEEYFLTQRRNAERTESVGLTDIEKVTSHGFDAKTSFRGNAR